MRLDDLDALVSDLITQVNASSSTIADTISGKADDLGYNLSDSMRNIWNEYGTSMKNDVLAKYGDDFSAKLTAVNTTISGIEKLMQTMVSIAAAEANATLTSVEQASQSPTASSSASSFESLGSLQNVSYGGYNSGSYSGSYGSSGYGSGSGYDSSSGSSSGWGSWFIKKRDTYNKSRLNTESSVVDEIILSTLNTLNCGETLRAFCATT